MAEKAIWNKTSRGGKSEEGLKGVSVKADDILVYGCEDTDEDAMADHDKNIEALSPHIRGPASTS